MPGNIVNDILALLAKRIPDLGTITIEKVVVGLGYSGVKLSTGNVGVCFTFQTELSPNSCKLHQRAGTLVGSSAVEMMSLARSWDLSESVIGIATVNALSSIYLDMHPKAYLISKGNTLDYVALEKEDTVVFVGRINPLIKRMEGKVKRILVLERDSMRREKGDLPDTACEEVMPQANVALITGTALANGSIDYLLELSKGAREIAIVGASASLVPDPLFRRGVTILGGIRVLDSDKLLQIVAEGGGTQQLKPAVEFVNLRPKNLS